MKLQKTLINLKKSHNFFFNLQNKGRIWINFDLLRNDTVLKYYDSFELREEFFINSAGFKHNQLNLIIEIDFFSDVYCFKNILLSDDSLLDYCLYYE